MGADDEESATALFTAGPGVWLGTPSPECNADPAGFRGTRAPSSSNAAICGAVVRTSSLGQMVNDIIPELVLKRQAVLSVKATPASRTADRSADGETNVQCRHGCITPTPPPVRRVPAAARSGARFQRAGVALASIRTPARLATCSALLRSHETGSGIPADLVTEIFLFLNRNVGGD
ncbi:unnamed protein product [Lampetra planeri]